MSKNGEILVDVEKILYLRHILP